MHPGHGYQHLRQFCSCCGLQIQFSLRSIIADVLIYAVFMNEGILRVKTVIFRANGLHLSTCMIFDTCLAARPLYVLRRTSKSTNTYMNYCCHDVVGGGGFYCSNPHMMHYTFITCLRTSGGQALDD